MDDRLAHRCLEVLVDGEHLFVQKGLVHDRVHQPDVGAHHHRGTKHGVPFVVGVAVAERERGGGGERDWCVGLFVRHFQCC